MEREGMLIDKYFDEGKDQICFIVNKKEPEWDF